MWSAVNLWSIILLYFVRNTMLCCDQPTRWNWSDSNLYSTVQYGTVREEEPSTSPPPSLAPLNLQLKDKTNLGFINIGCKILKSKIFLCWAQSLLHPERQTDLRFSLVIFLGFEFLLPNFWHVNPDNKKLGSLWKCSSLPASNLWSPLLSIMAVEKAIFTKILNKVVKFLYSKYWTSPTF